MDLAVIKSAQNNGTWEGAHGVMYVQEVQLEDGRVGNVNAKQPGRWSANDKVEVKEFKQTQYGNKMKLALAYDVSAADIEKGTTSRAKTYEYNNLERQNQINASWAIGQAIAMGYNDGDAIKDAARKLLAYRETIIGELAAMGKVKTNEANPGEQ